MLTIRFKKSVQFETARNEGPVYEAGSVHTFDDAFAQRWLRRDVAEVFVEPVRLGATIVEDLPKQELEQDLDGSSITVKREQNKKIR